jgi:hypothetical protein
LVFALDAIHFQLQQGEEAFASRFHSLTDTSPFLLTHTI